MFQKILIANRGEIALRIHRACREMGIHTVAVHSTADADAMHVRLADESVCIGPAPSRDSYLNIPAILTAAGITRADAIHPGVGFLSENARFAEMVEEHGIAFIGPSPEHLRIMGDKVTAKQTVAALGLPVILGSDGAVANVDEALAAADKIGYPVLIKASAGGGGKGMKVALSREALPEAMHLAQGEARANFGDDSVYLERYLAKPRHIEIQLFGDAPTGNAVHLGERDCSIQRRHQKLVEEGPSPVLTSAQRAKIRQAGGRHRSPHGLSRRRDDGVTVRERRILLHGDEHAPAGRAPGHRDDHRHRSGARADPRGRRAKFWSFAQNDIRIGGHAIECRINAENPDTFMPSPGLVRGFHAPGGPGRAGG